MTSTGVSFESLVEKSWSLAVFEAAHRFDELRPVVLVALSSPNGEVRSAAVAALNEANDQGAHDQVIALINDPDHGVQEEVLEYLVEFAIEKDSETLLNMLRIKKHIFLASSALKRLYSHGPAIHENDDPASQDADIAKWRAILGAR
jgi:HEAT repeat protein